MIKKTLFWLLPFLLIVASCQKNTATPNPPTVLVSVAPYAYFVHKIAGSDFPVHILVPEDSNPHVYEPKPKEVQAIADARLWVRLGDPADQKVYNVFKERNSGMVIADVTQGVPMLSECDAEGHSHCHHEGNDLHIWMSPRLAKIQAKTIAEGLITAFPEMSLRFETGLASFLEELDALDQELTLLLKPKENEAILVSHPAFAYFCQDYHLTQLSIEIEGKDPLPQHLTSLIDEAKKLKVTAVLLQPQYSNKGAELIAQELKVTTAMVNPYAEDYVDNLRQIAQIIAKNN
jgi:zinc transport system substrate-binding protein